MTVWYDVIMGKKTVGAGSAEELFDVLRGVASYDEARRAEAWAKSAEDKAKIKVFREDTDDDYLLVIGNDGKQIEILAFI